MSNINQRLDLALKAAERARLEFNEATKLIADALTHIHQRLEDLEKWKSDQASQ